MVQETKYLYDAAGEIARDAIYFSNIHKGVTSQRKLKRITALYKKNSKYWKLGGQNNSSITKENNNPWQKYIIKKNPCLKSITN